MTDTAAPTQRQVLAAQLADTIDRIDALWDTDTARINACGHAERRTYGLDGHAKVLLREAVKLASAIMNPESFAADVMDRRLRGWTHFEQENRRLRSIVKQLRTSARQLVEFVDRLAPGIDTEQRQVDDSLQGIGPAHPSTSLPVG